jgi:apolipoprotein N-acyltransferase
MERIKRLGPPVSSALLLLLAFPPFNLGLLVFVALVPWLRQLRESDGKQAWKSGYAFGLVYGFGSLFWLAQFVQKWTGSWPIGLAPVVFCTLLFALFFGLAGVLIRKCWAWNWPLAIPLVWAAIEVFRSYVPVFAFPWGLLAGPLWPYPVICQLAGYGTIYAVGAWCVIVSVIVAKIMDGDSALELRPAFALFFVGLLASFVRYATPPPAERMVITVLQPGVDMAFGDQATEFENLTANLAPMFDSALINGSQLVVLPEAVADGTEIPPKKPFPAWPELPMVFGAARGDRPRFQSVFAWDGKEFRYADKTRLVIFGEFVPFRNVIPYPPTLRLPGGDLQAGEDGVRSLNVAGIRVGGLLCFEALFPDIAFRHAMNGSRLIAVLSIDDWFMGTSAPDQLRAGSVWRAIETGTPVVRSASLGYTLAVDSRGRILGQLPLREPRALRVELEIPRDPQGLAASAAFPVACCLFTVGFALWPRRREEADRSKNDAK